MRVIRLIHAWAGLVLALFVAVIAFSGAFVSVRPEFIRLRVAEARAPAPPASSYGAALNAFEAKRPGELASAHFAPYHLGVHRLALKNWNLAFVDRHGLVVREWWRGTRLEEKALSLHHTLLLGEAGRILASLIGLAIIAMLVTGIMLIAPQLRLITLWLLPKSMARRDLISAHRNLALAFVVFFLVQVPTGVWVNLSPEISRFVESKPAPPPKVIEPPPGANADWHTILAAAQDGRRDSRIRMAHAPARPQDPYTVQLSPPGDLSAKGSLVVFLDWQGRVLEVRDQRVGSWHHRSNNLLFAAHSGELGPEWMRYVVGLVGLALGLVSLIGAAGYATFLMRPRTRPS